MRPVNAAAITTDSSGLTAGPVKIPVSGGDMPAYRAMPDKGKSFPVILVVHEIFGVHEYIQDICRRLAKQGYCAIAPDLYARYGDVAQLKDIQDIFKIVQTVPDDSVMSDLDTTLAWAKSSSKGDTSRAGITGYCWGGRIVWLYCARNPVIKAGVAWYGRLVGASTPLQPKSAAESVVDLKSPVLGLYGGKDTGISAADVETMRTELAKQKKAAEIIVYPEAQHGFHADYRPSYDEASAKDGWTRLLAWFKRHGVS
jgi:carboxymethylenebutenolidase